MEAKIYDLTIPQKSIYLLEKFYSGTNLNSLCGSSIVRTNINFDTLKKAINIIIQNNDSFRLHFTQENNEIKQYISNYKHIDIEIIDIPDEAHVQNIENSMLKRNFDIFSSDDLYEFKIFRLPNGHGGFSLITHHLLADSWSMGLVTNNIVTTYNNLIGISNKEIPTLSYTNFCINEKEYFNSEKYKKDKSYWSDIFKTLPEIASIPSKTKPGATSISCTANRTNFVIEKNLVDKINAFCKENKASIFNFLMAVYSLYISRVTGLNDFVIGTPILNRTNFAEKNTMGMFINTMPLRISTENVDTFNQLISDIAVKSMSMLRHQKYSYELILDDLREHNPNLPNLYNVLLSYQITKMTIDGVDCDTRWAFNGNSADELQIHILDFNNEGSLLVSYDYNSNKYCNQEISKLHNRILYIITQILDQFNSVEKIADLSLNTQPLITVKPTKQKNSIELKNLEIVTPEEKHKLINEFNNTSFKYDTNKNICQLFEEQVLKTPNNTAIVFEDCSLTYTELNTKSNQLANYLLNFNLKKGSIVGVLMNRSLELVISLLAIIKCGYSYVPIDPDYPEDRINFMLEDSKSGLVLVNSKTAHILNNYSSSKNITINNAYNPEFIEIRFSKTRKTISVNIDEIIEKINTGDVLTNINKNISLFPITENLNFTISPSATMYLIYTSGSTGKPKGVMVSHKNVHNFILGMKNEIDFKPEKVMVSVTTICFDIFGLELWCSLTSGMKLVIANEFEQNNSDLLNKLCLKNNVNIIQTTPSRFNMLVNGNTKFLKNITDILIGGESLSLALLQRLQHMCNANIYNVYGPTETTIWSTIKDITHSTHITIGKPILNTQCYILDDCLNLLPPYVPGNLYIGGDGVSKGYFNRNNLNNEKFIKSPFGQICSSKNLICDSNNLNSQIVCNTNKLNNQTIYNTNDLAYFTDSGEIVLLGRSDHQVKFRGYRIELGEIENIISKFQQISSCAVVIRNENLCVFYTTKAHANITVNELKTFILSNLPSYMMPSAFYKLYKMPFTNNGKIDRKSLQIPKTSENRNIILPKNDFEEKIFRIISKISNNTNFSMDDDFFAIGLDSINIISLALEISNLFNISISSREIISCQSVLNLINVVRGKICLNTDVSNGSAVNDTMDNSNIIIDTNNIDSANYIDDIVDVKAPNNSTKFYDLSSAQKRIYYATKMSNNPLVYNISGGLLVDKILDENKIRSAFAKLLKNHSSFRTCFKLIDGVPKQFVLNNVELNIPVLHSLFNHTIESKNIKEENIKNGNIERENIEKKSISKADMVEENIDVKNFENQNIQKILNDFPKEFNFEEAPLLRVSIHYINNSKTLILLDSHHIILDGTSLNILIYEFCKLYNNEQIEEEKLSYTDYSLLEHNYINSNNIIVPQEYWTNKFKGMEIPVINLPYDSPLTSKTNSFNGDKITASLSKELFEKITLLAKSNNVSPYVMFLSIFYIVLHSYTSQEDIIIGSPTVGRDGFDVQNTIGMFTNNIPLYANVNSNSNFADFISTVKNTVLEALRNQPYPYDMLAKALNLEPTSSLFDVMFIYQNENNELPSIENSSLKTVYANTRTAKFNLSLEIIPNEYLINLEYHTDLFKNTTAKQILDSYVTSLNNILKIPISKIFETKIGEISVLPNSEVSKVLYDFNKTKMDYNEAITIAELFETQVEKTPNNIALTFEDKHLTYNELNEKANKLAHFIRSKNIGRNDIIGIMIPRSFELIISILASFKTGCCYIPVDPSFPCERIDFMLNNSNSKILLTSKSLYKKVNFENKIVVDLGNDNIYGDCSISDISDIDDNKIINNSLNVSNITKPDNNSLNLDNITKPDDNSYIIYTSGSTGKPKGVVLKQKSLTNLACYLNKYFDFFVKAKQCGDIEGASTSINSRIFQNPIMASITTSSFDIFLFETIMCMQAGVHVVLANENEQRIPSKLNKLLIKNNVKSIQMTPSRMQFFVDNLKDIPALSNLENVVLAGEPLSESLKNTLLNIGIKKIYNGYGPSETTVFSTFTDVTNQQTITIGKGIANTQLYILNNNLNPCPIGVAGELYISGDGVGNGYLNNSELTNKCYINNPFIPNTIMYKVGDLCKFLENGEVLCCGRIDNQIKIRGLRIELGEIENRILEFPFIEKCVVVKQSVDNREFISAYYISRKRINKSELRGHLSKTLPNYMVPSYFTALDKFPHTPNGKIDKNGLPLPKISKNELKEYIAPSTELEITLVNIFEKILSISPIGLTDNFFELGGDSILAMSLNMELLKITDKITYADIFNNPTISDLVSFINLQQKNESIIVGTDNEKYAEILAKNLVMPKEFCSISNISSNMMKQTSESSVLKNANSGVHSNLLLTGVTGFLGIHILDAYLKNTSGKIYCIIRDEPGISAEIKLLNKLHYYFGNIYDNCINTRIFVIHGDICKPKLGLSESDYSFLSNNIDIVLNSAAKVTHFGKYEDFYKINVDAVKNLIEFCNSSKKFFQISTLSVSGNSFVDSYSTTQVFTEEKDFCESNFNIGQTLNNVYIRTKYDAEKTVLDSILNNANSYIIRVGNLMPRFSDGCFQENRSENAYLNRLSAFVKLGIIPENISNSYLEFTPIDFCAVAVVKIIRASSENNRIFHLFNHNHIYLNKLLEFLNELNYNIDVVETSKFKKIIKQILNDDTQKHIISELLNDFGKDLYLNYESNIKIKSDFTIEFLKNLNFEWPTIGVEYIDYILRIIKK